MFAALLPTALPTPRAVDEAAFVRWLRDSAHEFPSETPSAEALSPLVRRLAGAQIVGVGEATHGSHEDQAFKAELIKALVRAGQVRVLVLEANRKVGFDLDAYATGRGGDLPVLLRSRSFFRIWRTDEFAGLLTWLRAYNLQATRPVRVLGIDLQDPGVDADLALRFLAARDEASATRLGAPFGGLRPGPGSRVFRVWNATATKPVYEAAERAAKELERLFVDHARDWSGDPDYAEAAYAAKTARQAFEIFELEGGRGNPQKAGAAYYSRRDRFMAANFLERLRGRTAAFWAHDGHVVGDLPATDRSPAGTTWVGRELRRALGGRYATVTLAWSRGAFRAQTLKGGAPGAAVRTPLVPQALPNDGPGDLGRVLSQVGPDRFWADLRTLPPTPWARRLGATPYGLGWAGWGVDPRVWKKDDDKASLRPGTDVLVWFRQFTPSHLLPVADF